MIRFFDVFISALALILLTPLFVVVALLIFFEDNGPILFFQTRMGKNLIKFKIIKFRTMTHDKNRFQGEVQTNMNKEEILKLRAQVSTANEFDIRITRIGNFLRKTSIDELPQLLNVIIGNMSLVGPRPDTPIQELDYKSTDWIDRHLEKPGITGLSQIKGRSEITLEDRIKFDIEYTKKISLLLYFKILFTTISQVINSKGSN
jgi:lipopolysaccharide/colanic/teichoic acid biosynthesis glycosyltransferase